MASLAFFQAQVILATGVVVLSILVTLLYRYFFVKTNGAIAGPAPLDEKKEDHTSKIADDEGEDLPDYSKLFDTTRDADLLRGYTEHYEWNQSELEIEMFIYLKNLPDCDSIRAKACQVTISSTSLIVTVNGLELLSGDFFAKVVADDCNWQLDTHSDGQKILWLTLYKMVPTIRNKHWKCILKGDQEVDVKHLGPPVHGVDTNDKESIRNAINQIKAYNK